LPLPGSAGVQYIEVHPGRPEGGEAMGLRRFIYIALLSRLWNFSIRY